MLIPHYNGLTQGEGEATSIDLSIYPMDVVAEAFKMYIRLQEESLLPIKIYEHFDSILKLVSGFNAPQGDEGSSIEDSNNDEIEILVQLCQKLPILHKPILRRLLQLLWKVHCNSGVNKMTADNLRFVEASTEG
jgi:hypothetical protein